MSDRYFRVSNLKKSRNNLETSPDAFGYLRRNIKSFAKKITFKKLLTLPSCLSHYHLSWRSV